MNELAMPTWMTVDFVKEIRPAASAVDIKKCSSVVEVGDNYVAQLYRMDVEITNENGPAVQESYIVKSLKDVNPLINELGFVETEKEIYVDVLPEFTKIWQDVGKPLEFGPK